jgi:uncharacterized protein (DUF885 family)
MRFHTLFLAVSSASVLMSAVPALAQTQAQTQTQPVTASTPAEEEGAKLKALYDADWAEHMVQMGREPDGKGGYKETLRLPRVDLASQTRRAEQAQAMLSALDGINLDLLSAEDKVNAAVFRTNLEHSLIDYRARDWEMPINSDSNFWTYLDRSGNLTSREGVEAHLARLADIPRYFDDQMANMKVGLARGFTPAQITITGRDVSISSFITETAETNAFYRAFETLPSNMPAADQARLRAEAKAVIETRVIPAYRALLDFYNTEYLPAARTSLAAHDLPGGEAFYAEQIAKYTTLDLSADQIHQIGLSEVARIEAEMQAIMDEVGFKGTLRQFTETLRVDPRFIAKTPDELLMTSAWVAKRAEGHLARLFGKLPRLPYTIIPVPEALAPFYTAGRGGLGSCQMNTYDLPSRPLYNIPALTLHECAPGHSFQAALALEQTDVPDFRRSTYFSGYGEGWGLYTEYLGVEMGIYRTPYEHFGRLSYEMWRAARLVIDTGVHSKGWTRDQAQTYLADRTALSRREVETEVDRYISWPGQALSYKLGELTIRRLRTEAETALGERFDIKSFHDTILETGSIPLTTLEARIQTYIADRSAKPEA